MSNILALIAATVVLILIPGPNAALIVANSLRFGLRAGLLTAAGTTAGLALQLLLVVGGMAAVIGYAASALVWIKWLGVAYLLYLGIRTWSEPAEDLQGVEPVRRTRVFWRALALALANPKTLLFNAAFLPQFVPRGSDAAGELAAVTAVYLSVVIVGDGCWALFAAFARRWLGRFARVRNRVTAAFLAGGGLGLALSRHGG